MRVLHVSTLSFLTVSLDSTCIIPFHLTFSGFCSRDEYLIIATPDLMEQKDQMDIPDISVDETRQICFTMPRVLSIHELCGVLVYQKVRNQDEEYSIQNIWLHLRSACSNGMPMDYQSHGRVCYRVQRSSLLCLDYALFGSAPSLFILLSLVPRRKDLTGIQAKELITQLHQS